MDRRKFLKKAGLAVGAGSIWPLVKGCKQQKDFDIIILGGRVFDGLGNQPVEADVGIVGERIKQVGRISIDSAKAVIDARDLCVCPGFIDPHNHTHAELLVNPKAESAVRQGVTTLVSGNCGWSPHPLSTEEAADMGEYLREKFNLKLDWKDIDGFFKRLMKKGMALNYSTLVGQGSIRGAVIGHNDRPPKPEELERMKALVAHNIKAGAVGLSTGLGYAPGSFARTGELIELCKVAGKLGGVYATHMRSEGDKLLEAIDEALQIAREARISLQISHFKASYPRNWHKLDEAINKIEAARAEGIDVHCDRYPYIASSTGLAAYFPLWTREGTAEDFVKKLQDPSLDAKLRQHLKNRELQHGSWDKVVIADLITEKNKKYIGKNILECAQEAGKEPYDFIRDILIEEKKRVSKIAFSMNEDNLRKILKNSLVGIGSDGYALADHGPLAQGKPHPRSYGSFPRALGKYVREEKLVPLAEMIRKLTSVPAKKFKLGPRGVVADGRIADLVVFDQNKIIDKATFKDPHQYPEGIEYVLVNGQPVVEKGGQLDRLPGKIVKKAT
jgi:N-acyl-D-amino-acid deacylase